MSDPDPSDPDTSDPDPNDWGPSDRIGKQATQGYEPEMDARPVSRPIHRTAGRVALWTLAYQLPFALYSSACLMGWTWTLRGAWLAVIPVVLAVPVGFVAACTAAATARRGWATRTLVGSIVVFGVSLLAIRTGHALRMLGFERAAAQAMAVVAAVQRHIEVHGQPPEDLSAIRAAHPEIPWNRLPPLQIVTPKGTDAWPRSEPWALMANASIGLLNFDAFYYLPSEQYPDFDLGGVTERLGRWAYVHE